MRDKPLITIDGQPIEVRNDRAARRIALVVGGNPVIDLPYSRAAEFAHRLHQAGCELSDRIAARTT